MAEIVSKLYVVYILPTFKTVIIFLNGKGICSLLKFMSSFYSKDRVTLPRVITSEQFQQVKLQRQV